MASRASIQAHSLSTSNHTTESPLSNRAANDNDTIMMAKKFSSISLVEREERQQSLDRLEMLKTVRKYYIFSRILNSMCQQITKANGTRGFSL